MKKATKIILPVLILLGAVAIMFGLLALKKESPKRPPENGAKIVQTAVVTKQDVPTEVIAYGRVTSAEPVILYAEAGGTLEAGNVPFKPAQSFRKGDLLAQIDNRQTTLALGSAKSELMTALASVLPEIKVDFPDEYPVWQEYFDACRFDSELQELPETDNSRIRMFLSRYKVYQLYFKILDLEIQLDKHRIVAPFDGSIVATAIRVGSRANNGARLGEIISLEDMELAAEVPAEDLLWIDRKQPVILTSSEISGQWTGRIVRVGSNVDDRTQTVDVYIAVEDNNGAALLSGGFLQAHIQGKSVPNAFPVPPKALYGNHFVYLIVDGVLEKREVEILRRENEAIIVGDGLDDGDVLITEIMQGVEPGMAARSRNHLEAEGR